MSLGVTEAERQRIAGLCDGIALSPVLRDRFVYAATVLPRVRPAMTLTDDGHLWATWEIGNGSLTGEFRPNGEVGYTSWCNRKYRRGTDEPADFRKRLRRLARGES